MFADKISVYVLVPKIFSKKYHYKYIDIGTLTNLRKVDVTVIYVFKDTFWVSILMFYGSTVKQAFLKYLGQ